MTTSICFLLQMNVQVSPTVDVTLLVTHRKIGIKDYPENRIKYNLRKHILENIAPIHYPLSTVLPLNPISLN